LELDVRKTKKQQNSKHGQIKVSPFPIIDGMWRVAVYLPRPKKSIFRSTKKFIHDCARIVHRQSEMQEAWHELESSRLGLRPVGSSHKQGGDTGI
jgi:hypothetical protein